jgi:hypothetical protein
VSGSRPHHACWLQRAINNLPADSTVMENLPLARTQGWSAIPASFS